MDRTLRWMRENLSGARRAVHPPGDPHAGAPCTNSGTALLTCCYIDALGKVLLRGKGGNKQRFLRFVRGCMKEFLDAASTRALPPAPSGRSGGDEWLWEYRCGFVHGFFPPNARWRRSTRRRYWTGRRGVTLNVDMLVEAFLAGLEKFRLAVDRAPDMRANFVTYITMPDERRRGAKGRQQVNRSRGVRRSA